MQPTQTDRFNFSIDSAQETKRGLVTEYGIGEELPVTLIAWSQGELKAIGKVHAKLASAPQTRLEVVSRQAFAFRKGCAADAITLLCEGFAGTTGPVESLAARFAAGDEDVRECVMVLHLEAGEVGAHFAKVPYKYLVGRGVAYEAPATELIPTDGGYPRMLAAALRADPGTLGFKAVDGIDLEVFE